MNRIDLLKSFIDEDPKDPFNYYGLALEFQKLEDNQCIELFNKLLSEFPEYLPTYYTAAKHFESIDATKAKEIYQKGIELAANQNNPKSLNELKNALLNFEYEE